MNTPLATFAPDGYFLTGTVGIALLLALLALGVFFYFQRLPQRIDNRRARQLGTTLSLMVVLLCLGTAYFSWFTGGRSQPVVVYPDRIETGFGTVKKRDINRIQFAGEKQRSLLTGKEEKGTGMIMIEVRGGRRILIAEAQYDTETIYRFLQEWKHGK